MVSIGRQDKIAAPITLFNVVVSGFKVDVNKKRDTSFKKYKQKLCKIVNTINVQFGRNKIHLDANVPSLYIS